MILTSTLENCNNLITEINTKKGYPLVGCFRGKQAPDHCCTTTWDEPKSKNGTDDYYIFKPNDIDHYETSCTCEEYNVNYKVYEEE